MSIVNLQKYIPRIRSLDLYDFIGKVTKVVGLTIEVSGIKPSVGELCFIEVTGKEKKLLAEVVGFKEKSSLLMPLGEIGGIYPGCKVYASGQTHTINVGPELLGKVMDSTGRFLEEDDIALSGGNYPIENEPPNPLKRKPIEEILETGVKVIDGLLTCGVGQRMGIFAGSGVGKSTLLGMIARNSSADVNVIGLIGERGREVLEFIRNDLGQEGIARSVVIVSTSDEPALLRVKGALVATAVAEYFRDSGKNVLLMMDSVTRFAMAQREIGLAIGEPPTTRGYTPSVFAMLPRLLERAGNSDKGTITGLYTVLVDGDDMNEPVADAVRGILDGHIVLSRDLASQNHFPAIDVLQSVSRLMSSITDKEQQELASKLRNHLAVYKRNEDLINIGAYSLGSNPQVDAAIKIQPIITEFLKQMMNEKYTYEDMLANFHNVMRNE
ncbi:type III secretion system ATPase, FliI/YscN [Desulfonispora thiosulfatigenes DSM 11270]|uniref:Type III secretion system ATPase, FliI/YscN n=1 Tax=Desulfonispora thiosulfatigenes DSM 11270 TaxID=656914 RepID=A0A1W1UMZ4_DESTI|nr:flagellar protein export ATPase FliI [Desulfonispora thiosulfatigenes]SMB82466.1 type III secretion system ATPase, FliI/YscN [Desulfonispora thiosulfatigenes DSM 11270]